MLCERKIQRQARLEEKSGELHWLKERLYPKTFTGAKATEHS